MSFRRLPFQFSTTDPVERQRELEKRFGLPPSRNMFVDVANPLFSGSLPKESSVSSSPRLQHRIPIFVEGYDQPIHSSVDSAVAPPENKRPNVRVIPIEVEGAESGPTTGRHRTFSGPAGIPKEQNGAQLPQMNAASPLKHSMTDLSRPSMTKSTTLPRVHNIPIQVEDTRNFKSPKLEKGVKSAKANGCTVAKPKVKSPEKEHKRKSEVAKGQAADADKQKTGIESSLKKIENVLEEMKSYEAGVQEFSGTTKDKQYRYLDEMLTRCMLKIDDVDTMGNETVRVARKSAVRKIQASIDLLESKANAAIEAAPSSVSEVKTEEQETSKTSLENCEETKCQNEGEMTESLSAAQEATEVQPESASENASQGEVRLQKNDVEMTESQLVEPEVPVGEIASSQDVSNVNDFKITEKPSSEVHEVEMAEIKRASPSQQLNTEIPEVQMTDSTNKQNASLDNIPMKEENEARPTNEQLPSNSISQEDVEMKDVQSTLDDIKEIVAEENTVSCISSQSKENSDSEMSAELKTSENDAGKSTNNDCNDDEIDT